MVAMIIIYILTKFESVTTSTGGYDQIREVRITVDPEIGVLTIEKLQQRYWTKDINCYVRVAI